MDEDIPKLYATERIPFERKIIYRRYRIEALGFYWLIAELDRKKNLAFGYANLNNDVFAEWGYISIDELLENGAELDREWRPCTYRNAMKRIAEERKRRENRKEGQCGRNGEHPTFLSGFSHPHRLVI